jgi:hypothetical protein
LTSGSQYVLVLFMSNAGDITDEAGLNLLAQAELRLALGFAARAEAAEDAEVANGLARSYQRLARSYRQTLALKARLRRDLKHEAREDRADQRREQERAVQVRKAQVHAVVRGLIWSEAERAECERLEDELDQLLDLDAVADDFARTGVQAHVARLRQELRLLPPDPPPSREADREAVEGVRSEPPASTPTSPEEAFRQVPGGGPPSAFADSSPDAGATGTPDWPSSG